MRDMPRSGCGQKRRHVSLAVEPAKVPGSAEWHLREVPLDIWVSTWVSSSKKAAPMCWSGLLTWLHGAIRWVPRPRVELGTP